METIYMILAVAVFIAAIAVAFEWGYNRGTQEKSIEAKKAKEKEMKAQKSRKKKSLREEAEKARYDAILANIDNYTGDSKGQKEVISGGKEIL